MQTIHSRNITSILENDASFHSVTNHEIRSDQGALIRDYPELVEKVAQLSFSTRSMSFYLGVKNGIGSIARAIRRSNPPYSDRKKAGQKRHHYPIWRSVIKS